MIISGIINTYNEQDYIESCLQSIAFSDELLVVDSNSIDKTVQYAKKYTKFIYFTIFNNNYSEIRNYAIERANGDWILTMDGDEVLSEGAENIIRQLIKNKNIDGYWFPRRNYISKNKYLKHGIFYPDWQLRLFRNKPGVHYYEGPIHEKINIPESKTKKISDIVIYHDYRRSKFSSFFSYFKFANYIKIEGTDLAKKTPKNSFQLSWHALKQLILEFYWSFIKYKGYKDGFAGFRAAMVFALYKSSIYFYSAFIKLFR